MRTTTIRTAYGAQQEQQGQEPQQTPQQLAARDSVFDDHERMLEQHRADILRGADLKTLADSVDRMIANARNFAGRPKGITPPPPDPIKRPLPFAADNTRVARRR